VTLVSPTRTTIRALVIANGAAPSPLSPSELAAKHGLRRAAVHEAMTRERRAGRLRASVRQYVRTAAREGSQPAANGVREVDINALLACLDDEVVLSTEQRRKVLSRLTRSGPDPIKVQAVKTLEDMDRQQGRQVGPPEPQDDEELVSRVGTLLAGVGPDIGRRGIEAALAVWKTEAAAAAKAAARAPRVTELALARETT